MIRAAGVVALVVLPSMVGLAVLAEDAVLVVYGPRWEAAIPVIQVLAPVAAVQAISSVTASVMLAKGRSDWLYRWALAYCVAGGAAMLVSAQWGLVGVSLGLAAAVAVLTPFEMKMALGLIEMRLSPTCARCCPMSSSLRSWRVRCAARGRGRPVAGRLRVAPARLWESWSALGSTAD